MLRIGLTGGIGSGKSTVSNCFSKLGITVIDVDKITHEVITSDQLTCKKIVVHFGKEILSGKNFLNRSQLRKLIFRYPQKRKWLENLLHPLIISKIQTQLGKINSPYCILAIPLLAEVRHSINFLDHTLVVDIPVSLQIQRTKIRDQLSDEQITLILKSQSSREKRLAIADDVIFNDKTFSILRKAVLQLHSTYLKLVKKG